MKFFEKLFGSKHAEETNEAAEPTQAQCEHEWQRVVETQGASLSVNTKCAKCGDVMTPKRTVHHDMR